MRKGIKSCKAAAGTRTRAAHWGIEYSFSLRMIVFHIGLLHFVAIEHTKTVFKYVTETQSKRKREREKERKKNDE